MTQIFNEPLPVYRTKPLGEARHNLRLLKRVGDCFIFTGKSCQTIYSAVRREGLVGKISVRRVSSDDKTTWKVQRVKK